MREVIIAVDVGAGSLRAAAVRLDGRIAAWTARPLAMTVPRPGWAEADPAAWWRALLEGLAGVLDRLGPRTRPIAFCATGMTRSQVLVDGQGRPLRPAILWRDHRAETEARAVAAHVRSDNPATSVTAFHPVARLAWVARHEPAVFARAAAALEPKDYLNLRLTGRLATDRVSAGRYGDLVSTDATATTRAALALIDQPRLDPWQALGPIQTAEPPLDRLRGLPVFAGAMDTWTAGVGSGACRPGQAYDVAGTSEAVGLVTRGRVEVSGLVSLPWTEACDQVGGPTQAGGDAARWAYRAFRVPGRFAAAVERAGGRLPPDPPIFLPYLAGERAPVWRADARGAFWGLSRETGPDELMWATLEGVAHAVRDILETAATGAAQPAAEVRISGGGARSDAWCQLKASVLGVPIGRTREPEAGLVGAAIAAAVGLGRWPGVAAASDVLAPIERVFEPARQLTTLFGERAARFRRLKAATLATDSVATTAEAAR